MARISAKQKHPHHAVKGARKKILPRPNKIIMKKIRGQIDDKWSNPACTLLKSVDRRKKQLASKADKLW